MVLISHPLIGITTHFVLTWYCTICTQDISCCRRGFLTNLVSKYFHFSCRTSKRHKLLEKAGLNHFRNVVVLLRPTYLNLYN